MSRIRSTNTAPELTVQKHLRRLGLKFRRFQKNLPGRPDFIVEKKTALFVNGCFWHAHTCSRGFKPKSHKGYWLKKLETNRNRDKRNYKALKKLGYQVIVIWECQVKKSNFGKLTRVPNVDQMARGL